MYELLKSVNTGIPPLVYVLIYTVAGMVTISILVCSVAQRRGKIIFVWLIAYLFLMFYSTVLGRDSHDEVLIELKPFWSLEVMQSGSIDTFLEKLNNILFFVPYGMLLTLGKIRGLEGCGYVAIVGFITSVTIEVLQLITRTGMCETDDVICNTIGCVIGAGIVVAVRKVNKVLSDN